MSVVRDETGNREGLFEEGDTVAFTISTADEDAVSGEEEEVEEDKEEGGEVEVAVREEEEEREAEGRDDVSRSSTPTIVLDVIDVTTSSTITSAAEAASDIFISLISSCRDAETSSPFFAGMLLGRGRGRGGGRFCEVREEVVGVRIDGAEGWVIDSELPHSRLEA